MTTLEPIIPQLGGMQQFSYVENFVIKQKPIETGFRKNEFSLVKRDGTTTDDTRITEGEILGQVKYDNKIYVRDDLGKIYRFWNNGTAFEFNKIFDNTEDYDVFTENILGTKVRQKTIRIPYLSGLSETGTVVTAPNDPGSTPYTLTVSESIFSTESVNKYIYVPTTDSLSALQAGRWQFARIIKYNSATSVDLEFAFLGGELAVVAGNKIEVYDSIANSIVFNNIRKTENISGVDITTTVCINDFDEESPEVTFRSIYGDDILYLEGRVWTVNNGVSVSASIGSIFEITDSLTVLGDAKSKGTRNFQDSILAIEDYQKYILVFFSDSISIIWQIAYDSDTGTTIYGLNNAISGMSIFSSTSIGKKQTGLFIVTKEKQIGTIDITSVSEGSFNIGFTDQGYVIQDLLDTNILEGNDVYITSDNVTLNIIVSKSDETIVYRYYPTFQWWLPQRYGFKFASGFINLYTNIYYPTGQSLCMGSGELDLGEDISQELSITGPQTEGMDGRMAYMQQVVLGVGFFNNPIDFDIELEMGSDIFRMVIDRTVGGTEYIKWQNIASGDGSLGTNILGYGNLGGGNILRENISKMAILGFKVGVGFAGYFKITIRNRGNSNINISLVEFQYVAGNPYLVPIKNSF